MFFSLILLSAAAGLLGKGPMSKVNAAAPGGILGAEYYRFVHYQEPLELNLSVAANSVTNGFVHLRLGRAFLNEVQIERIDPMPVSETAGPKFINYLIRAEINGSTGIRVHFVPNHFGRLTYEVGLSEGPTLALWHFAFP